MILEKADTDLRAATSTTERVAAGLWREGAVEGPRLLLTPDELRWVIHTAGPALLAELEKAVAR